MLNSIKGYGGNVYHEVTDDLVVRDGAGKNSYSLYWVRRLTLSRMS
ncbi:hypothetical protein PP707_05900 [Acetobacter pasteurianus]|nr:hypothetical protein [Acetobacter pasteurianus]